ncbi:MAG: radical SAM protein [Sporolactobacillus sp.]
MVKISAASAENLWHLQNQYENNRLTLIKKLTYQYSINKWFGTCSNRKLINPKRFDKLHSISKLEIMVQTGCNLRCKYCYADGGSYHYGIKHLTPDDAIKYIRCLIQNLAIQKVGSVFFFGGEPTAYPKTIRAVCDLFAELVQSMQIKEMPMFTMVSNGTYYSPLLSSTLKKYNIELTISLDGPKLINDQLRVFRNGAGTFDKILGNIKKMQSDGISLNLIEATYTTLHKKLNDTPDAIRKYIHETIGEVKTIVVTCEGPSEYALSESITTEQTGFNNYPFQCEDCLFGNGLALIQTFLQSGNISSFLCASGASAISLTCDGHLYPCHRFLPDSKYELGVFENGSCNLNLYSSAFQKLIHLNKQGRQECKSCWARFFCVGCPAIEIENSLHEKICMTRKKYAEAFMLHWTALQHDKERFTQFSGRLKKLTSTNY